MEYTYTTRQGDTWDIIARNAYGTEMLAGHLQEANPGHTRLLYFPAGIVLTIPATPASASLASEAPWKRGALLSELPNAVGKQIIPAGNYGSGVENHGDLEGRDKPNQHPLSAIAWGSQPMDAIMQEIFTRLDEMDAGIGIGGGDVKITGETLYCDADGAALTYSISHTLGTKSLLVQPYNDATDKILVIDDMTITADTVTIKTEVPLPAGLRIRMVAVAPEAIGGEQKCGQTLLLDADGTTLAYTIAHSMGTKNIIVQPYDDATDKVIVIDGISTTSEAIIVATDVPLPAGMRVRMAVIASAAPADSTPRKWRYGHTQKTEEIKWVIAHKLGNKRPLVLVFDENGDEVVCKKDYANATPDSITVTLHTAMSGSAVVYSPPSI